MINPNHIRVYQCIIARTKDQPLVGGTNWMYGYVFKPYDPNTPKMPALAKQWKDFPLYKPHNVDRWGDLTMCNSGEGKATEVAFNEIDAVKYKDTLHSYWKMSPLELLAT